MLTIQSSLRSVRPSRTLWIGLRRDRCVARCARGSLRAVRERGRDRPRQGEARDGRFSPV